MARFLSLIAVSVWAAAPNLSPAAELAGTVNHVQGTTIALTLDGGFQATAGDRLAVVIESADAGRALVAEGKVTTASGPVLLGTLERTIGQVRVGQRVVVRPEFPASPPAASTSTPQAPPAATDKRLEGVWLCTETLVDGQPSQSYVGAMGAIFGDRLTFIFPMSDGQYAVQETSFTLDTTASPMHFDWRDLNAASDRIDQRIYEVNGDTMRWGSNSPGSPRPTSFETARYQFICKRLQPASASK